MFNSKSRYITAKPFTADDDGNIAFSGVRARDIGPATGVIEHEVQVGDRLDLLARHYYNNDRAWWRIVDANPQIQFADNMLSPDMEGDVIVIPKLKQ